MKGDSGNDKNKSSKPPREKKIAAKYRGAIETLDKLFEDRSVSAGEKLLPSAGKPDIDKGNNQSYKADKLGQTSSYRVKPFNKGTIKGSKLLERNTIRRYGEAFDISDWMHKERLEGIREFIAAPLYERLLYWRAPKIGLVQNPRGARSAADQSIAVKSKYIKGKETNKATKTLKEAMESGQKGINIAKVFAASIIMGDKDYHYNNIMIDEDGERYRIDFGKSLMFGSTLTLSELFASHDSAFTEYKYYEKLAKDVIVCNIGEVVENMETMLATLQAIDVDAVIDGQMLNLKKAGVVLSNEEQNYFEKMKRGFKAHRKTCVTVVDGLKAVRDIEGTSLKFKNGLWLGELAKVGEIKELIRSQKTAQEREAKNRREGEISTIEQYVLREAADTLKDPRRLEFLQKEENKPIALKMIADNILYSNNGMEEIHKALIGEANITATTPGLENFMKASPDAIARNIEALMKGKPHKDNRNREVIEDLMYSNCSFKVLHKIKEVEFALQERQEYDSFSLYIADFIDRLLSFLIKSTSISAKDLKDALEAVGSTKFVDKVTGKSGDIPHTLG